MSGEVIAVVETAAIGYIGDQEIRPFQQHAIMLQAEMQEIGEGSRLVVSAEDAVQMADGDIRMSSDVFKCELLEVVIFRRDQA